MTTKKVTETRTVSQDEEDEEDDYYFTQETENSIVKYNEITSQIEEKIVDANVIDVDEADDVRDYIDDHDIGFYEIVEKLPRETQYDVERLDKERNRLYRENIQGPFKKLVESIFNKYKFSYFDVPYEDVQRRVVHHLVEKIHMFDPDSGSKAFSYFSMIARNKLIQINNKNYDRYKESEPIDDPEKDFDIPMEENFEDEIQRNEFFEEMIDHWRNRISKMFSKKRDIRIADALMEIFEKRNSIETFNKKGLYVMIREMTGVERTQHITKVVKKFREEYEELAENYRESGSIEGSNQNKFFDI